MSFKSQKIIVIILTSLLFLLTPSSSFCNSNDENSDILQVFSLLKSVDDENVSFEQALQLEYEAIKISKQINCDSCLAESYYYLGASFYYNLKPDSALVYLDTIIDFYKKSNNANRLMSIYDFLAYVNRDMENPKEAIKYARLGLNIADSLGIRIKVADFYLFIGTISVNTLPDKEQVEALVSALSIFEKENDSLNITYALINLGTIFANDDNYIDAFEVINRALQICIDIGDEYGVSVCLNNLGDFSLSIHEYKEALSFFQRSLEIDKISGDAEGESICSLNIGDSYKGLKDTVLAVSYYVKSIDISTANNYSIAGIAYIRLGEIYLSNGSLRLALKYAKDGLRVMKLYNDNIDMVTAYDLLHRCSAAMGNYEQAYKYFTLCKQINDSIFSIDKSKNIQKIISTYHDEKQKSEISILKKKSFVDSKDRTILTIVVIVISAILLLTLIVSFFNRRSRKKLLIQKQYYDKLLDWSEDFIFVIDKNGLTKYVSPSYQRKIGRIIENRVGKNSFEFIHPDDIDNVKKKFAKLAFNAEPRKLEFRIQKDDGFWIDVSAYGQNLLDDPVIEGIVVNFWDITQRKKNEGLIKVNEAKFRQIFNSFPDIYFEADLSGIVTEISPSVTNILGYTRDEIVGMNTKEYYSFISDWKRIGAQFKIDSFISDFDTKVVTKAGLNIHCSFSAEYMLSADDVPMGIKGVMRDVSNRIVGQNKLRESQKMLKEANRSKELLFSIISHDLIGPIGTNKSIVDLIVGNIDGFSHEEIVSLITSLKPSLDSTFSLIENLLSWARIQQDRLKPNFENISLNMMVSEMVLLLSSQAEQKSIELKIIETNPITVFADKNQLDILLRNLVSNAIKFSYQTDEVIISIDTNEDMAVIKVIDKGIGLTAYQIDNILVKGGSTIIQRGTDNEKGTGFGLIIVNEFVKNNNGNLNIQSKIGEGTTFVIELPLNV